MVSKSQRRKGQNNMSRGRIAAREPKEPDTKYKSRVVSKFINMVMLGGKKSTARKIVYTMLESIDNEDVKEARRYFEEAVKNVMPEVEVRTRRVGGANYQVPVPVKHDRAETVAMRWILTAAKNQKGSPISVTLSNEIKSAYSGEGSAVKKKQETHKMAEANKAFAHFKW